MSICVRGTVAAQRHHLEEAPVAIFEISSWADGKSPARQKKAREWAASRGLVIETVWIGRGRYGAAIHSGFGPASDRAACLRNLAAAFSTE